MNNQVKCNKCNKKFVLTKVHSRDIAGALLKEHYFICPHCKQEYITHVTDQQVQEWENEIAALREKIKARITTLTEDRRNAVRIVRP